MFGLPARYPTKVILMHRIIPPLLPNTSTCFSLGSFYCLMRTIVLFFMFSLLLLAGCASVRSSEEPPSKRGFFESPDTESLH